MKNIINFNSRDEFYAYIKERTYKCIGSGSEGAVFRGFDNMAYKYIEELSIVEYDVNKIITTSDITSDSFAFPETLFTVQGKLSGYTSALVSRDLLGNDFLIEKNTVDHIDFDKLIDAYYKLKEDAIILTEAGIKIFDLSFNLLFDEEKLVGVDTCGYSYNNSITLEKNIHSVDSAIRSAFYFFLSNKSIEECNAFYQENASNTVEDFLHNLESRYKSNTKNKVYVNKKSSN